MAKVQQEVIVGVFADREKAQQAVNQLRAAGFREDQIGVAARDGKKVKGATKVKGEGTKVEEGAVAGLAAGAGVGALWGLGIVAGILPAIGPAIAGGTLAAILSSTAAGAAVATLAGALIGLGIPEEEAEFYEKEFQSGKIIVTVKAGRRTAKAREILSRHGAYDIKSREETRSVTTRTGTLRGRTSKPRTTLGTKATRTVTHKEGEKTIPVKEEEIQVKKRPVKTGEVRVRKEVHVEPRTVEVPVTSEEVVIERRPAGRRAAGSNINPAGEEIHIPVSSEQVHIEKRPVVTEEVTVGKRKVSGTRRVSSSVRKEKVRVEKQGNPKVDENISVRNR